MEMLKRPDGFDLYGKLGVNFFSTSDLLYPNKKGRLQLIRARPNFHMISDNPNVSLGMVDCSLYTCRIAVKVDYHKRRIEMLAETLVEYKCLETLANTFIIPATHPTSMITKTFSTMLQFLELPLQSIQTLHSLIRILKILSCINSSISDILEYSAEVSQC